MGCLDHLLPVWRCLQAARRPHKKGIFEIAPKARKGMTCGGLGKSDALGGDAETRVTRESLEQSQLRNVQSLDIHIRNDTYVQVVIDIARGMRLQERVAPLAAVPEVFILLLIGESNEPSP